VRVVRHPGGQFLEKLAATGPRITTERQLDQPSVQSDLPHRERHQSIAVQSEDLERAQRQEGQIADVADHVVLQVELAQMRQSLELEALQFAYPVILEVENLQVVEAVERAILNGLDAARVHVEHAHVLATDEHVVLQLAEHVAVQVYLGGVHRYPPWDFTAPKARAVDRVCVPRAVVVALAAGRAGHLAVTGVKVATVTEGEAMSLVTTEELLRAGGRGRYDRDAAWPRCTAHYVVQVHDAGILARRRLIVDGRQPVHRAVTVERVAADVEFRQRLALRHFGQQQRRQLHRLDHVGVHVDPGEVHLVGEGVWPHGADVIVVDEEQLHAVRHGQRPQLGDAIVTGVQGLDFGIANFVIVTETLDIVAVDIEPLEITGYEGVIEPLDVILRQIQQQQTGDAGEHAVDVRQEVAVEPDRLQPDVALERVSLHVLHLVAGEIEDLQIGQIPEHTAGQVADVVADETETGELMQIAERAIVELVDPVLA